MSFPLDPSITPPASLPKPYSCDWAFPLGWVTEMIEKRNKIPILWLVPVPKKPTIMVQLAEATRQTMKHLCGSILKKEMSLQWSHNPRNLGGWDHRWASYYTKHMSLRVLCELSICFLETFIWPLLSLKLFFTFIRMTNSNIRPWEYLKNDWAI